MIKKHHSGEVRRTFACSTQIWMRGSSKNFQVVKGC